MEFELVQDVVDEFRPAGILIYAIERVVRGIDRQCRDVEGLVVGGNGGDAGGGKRRPADSAPPQQRGSPHHLSPED
jgi:hypothetical protein